MWQIYEPYYSEKTKLKLLKSATTEQLIEYLYPVVRRKERRWDLQGKLKEPICLKCIAAAEE